MADAGIFNKRISIMGFVEIENEIGQIEQGLRTLKKLWSCKIDIDKGSEYLESQRLTQMLMCKFIVRKSKFTDQITQNMFVVRKGVEWNIRDIIEKDATYHLICEKRVVGDVDRY